MEFDSTHWKAEARRKYEGMMGWLRRQTAPAGLAAYSSLATFTLWPLVEYVSAAAQSGQPLPVAAILALGSTAGGVGSNLIASQIQNWYQAASQGDAPTEETVLAWLNEHVVQQPELQQAVDQILEKLEAVTQVQQVLPPPDWQALAGQLAAELPRLEHSPLMQASLEGSGIILQGNDHIVATHGSTVFKGDVAGDVYLGGKDPGQTSPKAMRRAYLNRLLDQHNQLLLAGVDPKATAENDRLELSAVYTALLTESSEARLLDTAARTAAEAERKQRPLSALEQLDNNKHLVLLGDPGSGKSTFVSFVAMCLAGQALEHERLNLALLTEPVPPDDDERRPDKDEEPQPQPWRHGALLPVCIVLRDFAARGLPLAGQKASTTHLWQFVEEQLAAAALAEYAPILKKELLEQGGIFLFDGLDEVPAADEHRLHIKQMVEDVARTFSRCRILVTGRTYAYQKQAWRLPQFADTVLATFSQGQITLFVDRWYAHIGRVRHQGEKDTQGRAALLKQAIFGSKRLHELAQRPLLLTLMASLHAWRGGSLPEKREELYADAVDLLLDLWEQQRIVRDAGGAIQVIQPGLEQWLDVDRDKVRQLLNRLAFEAHAKQTDLVGTADVAEQDLVMGLLSLSQKESLQPASLLAYLSQRAGLLLPRGVGIYTFPHRTFQEYLAACHLTVSGYPEDVARLARTDPNRWREVALLAGAKAARGSAYALWGLVQELCHTEPGQGGDEAYWGAHLAAHFLVESARLDEVSAAQQGHLDRVRRWLLRAMADPVLPAVERALAGRHLAQLGDSRRELLHVDEMVFSLVPAGDFWMGEGKEAHRLSFLSYDYWLGRYPVTHAQFMQFASDGGYGQDSLWEEAIKEGLWKEGKYMGRTTPYDWGDRFRLANGPVVGVSWFEALAFCRWLTARWREKGWLPAAWQVTLPSEAEWEKGARGGVQVPLEPVTRGIKDVDPEKRRQTPQQDNPDPRRHYPWLGQELNPELANYDGGEINSTSSLGCFPEAASVYGCQEMMGNVFEWTRSLEKAYPYQPDDGREVLKRGSMDLTMLRGGAWAASENYSRCAARFNYFPFAGYFSYGFRLVLSPL